MPTSNIITLSLEFSPCNKTPSIIATLRIVDSDAELCPLLSVDEQKCDLDVMKGHSAIFYLSEHERIEIFGFHTSVYKNMISIVGYVLSLGILRLLFHWQPKWHLACTKSECPLIKADTILITDSHHSLTLKPVLTMNGTFENPISLPCSGGDFVDVSELRYFCYRKLDYAWHPKINTFAPIFMLDCEIPISRFHDWTSSEFGLTTTEVARRLFIFGRNIIDVKLKPIYVVLFKEAITPFYIFQLFSVIAWYIDEYEIYATVILFISLLSIIADVYQVRSQERKLRLMVDQIDRIDVIREGKIYLNLDTDLLVPGDLMLIPNKGCTLHCDSVLLNGTCIVNESMLTGESVPVTKVVLPPSDDYSTIYSNKKHAKHTLYCGTKVLQTRFYSGRTVQALVIRTGYSTLKGQLVRSIMYPKPVDFRFTNDLFKFVGVLAIIAFLGFCYSMVVMISHNSSLKRIVLRSLGIITIVVPPALPAAMTIGIFAAQMRLKKQKIFCISPSTINTCGGINVVCFDKTGTLTEEGLAFHSLLRVESKIGEESVHFGPEKRTILTDEKDTDQLVKAMAVCHSLTRIEGRLVGDPLDMILFEHTGWLFDEPINVEETDRFDSILPTIIQSSNGQSQLGVIRQLAFSNHLHRMSVIVRQLGEQDMNFYCKGAPETVVGLCDSKSVPKDWNIIVNRFAEQGFRLIALAGRPLRISFHKAQRISRENLESGLQLLGIVAFENRLKSRTISVIEQLQNANIRCIMLTGDNLLTAMSVARKCQILQSRKRVFVVKTTDDDAQLVLDEVAGSESNVNSMNEDEGSDPESISKSGWPGDCTYQLAIDGNTLRVFCHDHPELVSKLVSVCDVYTRMSPEQKQLIINHLQQIDYTVAMCGDGANDCGALKAAHVGISLSQAESSIASPFTSQTTDIDCVPTIIREGRAALTTSFSVFKFMASYSLTQFCSVLLLYWTATNLSDFQFLYIDLVLITTFAVFFGYTAAAFRLSSSPPPVRLLSLSSVLSIAGQMLIIGFFQLFVFFLVASQSWFRVSEKDDDITKPSYRGTVVFLVSTFQYIALTIVYSNGHSYRRPIYTNLPLTISLIFLIIASIWLTLRPSQFAIDILQLYPIPSINFRFVILVISLISVMLGCLFENFIIDGFLYSLIDKSELGRVEFKKEQNEFQRLLRIIGSSPNWLRKYGQKLPIHSPESPDDCQLIE